MEYLLSIASSAGVESFYTYRELEYSNCSLKSKKERHMNHPDILHKPWFRFEMTILRTQNSELTL